MNEYKRYDSDLKAVEHLVNDKKEKPNNSASIIITSVIIAVISAVVVCSILIFAFAGKFIMYIADNFILGSANTVAEKGNLPLVEDEDTKIYITPREILNNIVTVSVDGRGGFLGGTAALSSGNGIFIREGGIILTSAYILETEGDITVTLSDGVEYNASVLGTDKEKYISVLRIDKVDAPTTKIGDSDKLSIGDRIIGVGNKVSSGFTNPMTFGYLCGYDTDVELADGSMVNFLQTDASSLAGSVGGMLFNYSGELVGMCTAKYSSISSNISLVTPINDIINNVNAIIDNIPIEKTQPLGITATDADYGVTVDDVIKDSIADKSGIKRGDLIMKINGQTVHKLNEIVKIKGSLEVGEKMNFTLYRNGETIDILLVLE